jgi:hypothetical protein
MLTGLPTKWQRATVRGLLERLAENRKWLAHRMLNMKNDSPDGLLVRLRGYSGYLRKFGEGLVTVYDDLGQKRAPDEDDDDEDDDDEIDAFHQGDEIIQRYGPAMTEEEFAELLNAYRRNPPVPVNYRRLDGTSGNCVGRRR